MNRIFAIDPGPTESAWVRMSQDRVPALLGFGITKNEDLRVGLEIVDAIAIEKVCSYGMAVGEEVFETVFWSGRFAEQARCPVARIPRLKVKLHLCRDSRAKDANIRQALIDLYGGKECTRRGGALHGVSKDVWAALAVGVTFLQGGHK